MADQYLEDLDSIPELNTDDLIYIVSDAGSSHTGYKVSVSALTAFIKTLLELAISDITNLQTTLDGKASLGANTFTGNQDINSSQLRVSGAATPQLVIATGGSSTSFLRLRDNSATQATIAKHSQTGETLIDIDPVPVDGVSRSLFRFFRAVNTTGTCTFELYKGDNTASINSRFGGNTHSYLNALVGNVAIGTTTATEKLTVSGNASLSGWVKPGVYTVATLPTTGVATGASAFASNGRKSGEGSGSGTGVSVWYDGSNWKTYYDNTTVEA